MNDKRFYCFITLLIFFGMSVQASLLDVKNAYDSGQFFSAARIAFNDANHATNDEDRAMAYYWVTQSMVRAGLDQSALYFFLRTLQFKDRTANKKVLEFAPLLIERVGPDLMKIFLSKYTRTEDYSNRARNAFALVVAKDKLLKGDYSGVVQAVALVQTNHPIYPVALQMRATAEVMLNHQTQAIRDFSECADKAEQRIEVDENSLEAEIAREQPSQLMNKWNTLKRDAARDLKARCIAGKARTEYELGRFEDADRSYDKIPKASFVWTDTLFEHAWNSFARDEFNRTLGKLVSYKSPALKFVFNTEIDVLMAQSYLSLCLYGDAQKVIEEFNRQYGNVAKEIKVFVDSNPSDLRPYYTLGRQALIDKLHTERPLYQFMNRFVRAPYFQTLTLAEDRVIAEKIAIARMDESRPETSTGMAAGFPGFLNLVLDWRLNTIQRLGGIYVKNSMVDYHQVLISDFEKMQFMKIDLLAHLKQKLQEPESATASERSRGNRIPVRRSDQLLWNFNGEFWNDEIGDYVFALQSECGKKDAQP